MSISVPTFFHRFVCGVRLFCGLQMGKAEHYGCSSSFLNPTVSAIAHQRISRRPRRCSFRARTTMTSAATVVAATTTPTASRCQSAAPSQIN